MWKVWSSDDPHTEEISEEKGGDGGGGVGWEKYNIDVNGYYIDFVV